jgi:hypothetical protein
VVAAVLLARPVPGGGPFARDFEAYDAAGATRNAGADPYGRAIWQAERTIPGVDATHDEMLPFVGPAFALPLWSAFARLPFGLARALWEGILALAFLALVTASLALAGGPFTPARTLAALALGATSGAVISAIALGQAALLGAAGTAVTLLLLERRSAWAIGTALVAAIQPNLALPLVLRLTGRRAIASLAAAAAAFLAITLAVGGGVDGVLAYARRLRLHDAAERFTTIQHTVPAIVASFGAGTGVAEAVGTIVSFAAIAVAIVASVRLRAQPVIAVCIGIALVPLAVPFFHEHDFAIDLAPAIVLLVRGDAAVRRIAGTAAVLTFVDWLGLAQHPAAVPQTLALALGVAASCALLGRFGADADRDDRAALLAPFGVACLVALNAVPLAHGAPAPNWPASLGPYHAPPGADLSAIWADEGRRAGLDAAVPAWGVLRAIPLAGCVCFAYALTRLARPAYATKTAPSRTASATLASESPVHGPSMQ